MTKNLEELFEEYGKEYFNYSNNHPQKSETLISQITAEIQRETVEEIMLGKWTIPLEMKDQENLKGYLKEYATSKGITLTK